MSDQVGHQTPIHLDSEQASSLPETTTHTSEPDSSVANKVAQPTTQEAGPPEETAAPEPSLEERAAALEAELAEERDRRLRAMAELANFRRRAMEERAQQLQYANERLLADLIPVIDHFELATSAAEANEKARIICKGYEMILQQLKDVTARYGLTEIPCSPGTFFDPELHEAVESIPTDDPCEGTIMKVIRKGYRLHDRVLRPVHVAVAVPRSRAT